MKGLKGLSAQFQRLSKKPENCKATEQHASAKTSHDTSGGWSMPKTLP